MIKKIATVSIILLVFSCKSAKIKKGGIPFKEVNRMDYTEIFYSFNNDKELTSKVGANLIKFNRHALDSVFLKNPNKFKIRNKLDLEKDLTPNFMSALISSSNNGLSSEYLPKIPNYAKLQQKNTQFLLIPYIKPYLKLTQSYSSLNTILITEPSYSIKSFELTIFILDVAKNNISFYGSKKVKLNKGLGYGHSLIGGINEIFEEFKNSETENRLEGSRRN